MQTNMRGNFNRDFFKLPWVELVGMAVKDKGGRRHDVFCKVATCKPGKKTMIPTTSYGPVFTQASKRCNGKFCNIFLPWKAYLDRVDRPVRNAISCPPDRENA